jgi:carboxylesterase
LPASVATVNVAPRREKGYGVGMGARLGLGDAAPFSLGSGTRGVLLVHGFTGSPFEVRLLGEDLARRGFAVEGPLLAGHGARTRDMRRAGWHDWLHTAAEALERLRARVGNRKVGIAGLSMGALVTLELARTRPNDIAAIACLSPAFWLRPEAEAFSQLVSRVPFLRYMALPKLAGSDIRDPEMRKRNGIAQGKAAMPMPSLASLIAFQHHLRDKLGEVRAPTLLMHSERDHTVPIACMDAVAHRLVNAPVRTMRLVEPYHVITLDVGKEIVFEAVAEHFTAHLPINE